MKKIIYIGSWLILTATDSILGYKTARSDFLIDNIYLAVIFSLGFSLLSVPLKLIYDRVIEDNYKGYGKSVFYLFAITWLFVAFLAYRSISDMRVRNMSNDQIKTLRTQQKANIEIKEEPKNSFGYYLSKRKLIAELKQDSLINAQNAETNRVVNNLILQSQKNADKGGFFYFNLLLILSASVCLSIGMKDETIKQEINFVATKQKKRKEKPAKQDEQQFETFGDNPVFNTEIEYQGFKCLSCGREFENKWGYNVHFKNNQICEKSNYARI